MDITKMQLTDWLDDLSVRFIVNLPREELESVERICFQVEEAQWFYEDFVRPLNPNLPSLTLRQFSMKIFQHCPLFSSYGADVHSKAFSEFLAYKTRVPVRGAILLNETLDQVILVKGWKKGANWSFPRGKINKDEKDIDCAIREVYEETGYDVSEAGLVGKEEDARYIEVTMREQHMKLFVFAGVPMSTHFEPRTRKEISKIQWYKLSELPTLKKAKQHQHQQQHNNNGVQDATNHANKFYMVAPFLNPLKKIISSLKRDRLTTQIDGSAPTTQLDQSPTHLQNQDTPAVKKPGNHDIVRLMAQLRQSQQASRETNLPEVSSTASGLTTTMTPGEIHAAQHRDHDHSFDEHNEDVARRESKANAMLSILRGGDIAQPFLRGPYPQTPSEQIMPPPSEPPSSPKPQAPRTMHAAGHRPPPGFPLPPSSTNAIQNSLQTVPNSTYQGQFHTKLLREKAIPAPVALPQEQIPYLAPYRQTGEPGFTERETAQPGVPSVPPASKLPPPKLNKHSSSLLDLFKSPVAAKAISVSSPTVVPLRQELSVSSPGATQSLNPSLTASQAANSQAFSSTPALATSGSSQRSNHKHITQQEALLSLFRQPKPSPSLVPPDDPVELSAQGSPTQSRLPFVDVVDDAPPKPLKNGKVTIQKRPAHKSGVTSATVTGPVNVPQFDELLQQSKGKTKVVADSTSRPSPAQPSLPRPVKILSRPAEASGKVLSSQGTNEDLAKPAIPSQRHRIQSINRPSTNFHPTILKRPDPAQVSSETSPRTIVPVAASSLGPNLVQASTEPSIVDRRSSQSLEHKTALLALFAKPQGPVGSPTPLRTTAVVSPLSEKPPAGSELPSPLGLSRSRLGSLQDGGASGKDLSRSGGASPGDKKFLLGFLDGVVREGRK